MSQSNKYLNNTIYGRYRDDTPDAILSKVASNLIISQEELGYKIINTRDYPINTAPEVKYACYDFTYSMDKYMIFSDIYSSVGVEKYDDLHKIYKATVRHFLIKKDASIWVKQIVYSYPRSIFTLSDQDRDTYTKELMKMPSHDSFVTYYSSVYALKTKSPSQFFACNIGVGSGCFKSEFDYYLKRYNDLSSFGNMSPQVVQDKSDVINAFYMLTGEDITSIGYNSSTQSANESYIYNNMLMNKPYSTGAGSMQQGPYLHYVADNKTIADNQTNIDTQTLSPSSGLREPPSVIQPTQPPQNNTGVSQPNVSQSGNPNYSPENDYIHDGYASIPVSYPTSIITSGIGDDAGRYYLDDYIEDIRREKCEMLDYLY